MIEILLAAILVVVVVNLAFTLIHWRRPKPLVRVDEDRVQRDLEARRKRREIRTRSG